MHQNPHNYHAPVMLAETLECLQPKKGERYLDVTAGYGGHAEAILKRSSNYRKSVLVDRDGEATKELERKFKGKGLEIINSDFLSASRQLLAEEKRFDLILADLGVSSPHLNEVKRGFSFNADGPLDMRMDQRQNLTAGKLINHSSEAELVSILKRFGEEPKARMIARLIIQSRPLHTTAELASIATKAWPAKSRSHPASRTFQAFRIAVNDELQQLNEALPIWLKLLEPGGRIAVISFHSLEDRIVKKFFTSESGDRYDAVIQLLTRHPVLAAPQEIAHNPRARSAKLRAAAKTKKEGNANAYSGKKQLPSIQNTRPRSLIPQKPVLPPKGAARTKRKTKKL